MQADTVHTTPPDLDAYRAHWSNANRLPMWTIYRRPKDNPDGFVARMFLTLPAPETPRDGRVRDPEVTGNAIHGPTLEAVRAALPAGLWRLARAAADDPFIVEVWL